VAPGSVSSGGEPALVFAASGGSAAVVELMLGAGARVDVSCSDGCTPLMEAARCGHLDVVRLLLLAGADPALKDERGNDALAKMEGAHPEGHAEVAALLRDPPQPSPAPGRAQDVMARIGDQQRSIEHLNDLSERFITAEVKLVTARRCPSSAWLLLSALNPVL
jgi:ankyrin repeat protein